MATKLTKAFAEFVGGRGFLIANEGEISQQPGADYKRLLGDGLDRLGVVLALSVRHSVPVLYVVAGGLTGRDKMHTGFML